MMMKMIVISLYIFAFYIGYIRGQGCGFPGTPANGGIQPSKRSYKVGEMVAYYCNNDSVLMGTSLRECMIDGKWSDDIPACSTPLHPLGSTLAAQIDRNHHSYLAIDGNKTSCIRSTKWWRVRLNDYYSVQAIAVTMPKTSVEQNFTVYVIFKNSTDVVYLECASFEGTVSRTLLLSCAEELRGNIVHIEDIRNTSQEFEICEIEIYIDRYKYKCGKPDSHIGSHIVERKRDRVSYGCSSGFMLNGTRERVCLPNGRWSESAPKCVVDINYDKHSSPEEI